MVHAGWSELFSMCKALTGETAAMQSWCSSYAALVPPRWPLHTFPPCGICSQNARQASADTFLNRSEPARRLLCDSSIRMWALRADDIRVIRMMSLSFLWPAEPI